MSRAGQKVIPAIFLAAVAVLLGIGLWKSMGSDPILTVHGREFYGVMGTGSDTHVKVIVRADEDSLADRALDAARNALTDTQRLMDPRMEGSEVRTLNEAPAGQPIPLAPETLEVLRDAQKMWSASDGAFDITIGPLIQLWHDANAVGKMPTPEQIAQARDLSSWSQLKLTDSGAVKSSNTVSVDLGGIAKGYGIDRAIDAIRQAGCQGGLVEVGGDLRCFGAPPGLPGWTVGVRNPYDLKADEPLVRLRLRDLAVCTSGHYFRFYEFDGVRYSHILDPRPGPRMGMGLPPEEAPRSVTVIAPTAAIADAWATALCILGPEGFALLKPTDHVEAMMLIGPAEAFVCHQTAGFAAYQVTPALPHTIVGPAPAHAALTARP